MARQPETNQKLRTRRELLHAASRMVKAGKTLSVESVASEAFVSRATAYRYFPSIEMLLAEIPVDSAVPNAGQLFDGVTRSTAEERIDHAEGVMHESIYENERQLRSLLAQNLAASLQRGTEAQTPVRQNRRGEYIEAALAPFRKEFDARTYKQLCAALSLIFGTEAMIVFRDVLPLSPRQARSVKSWAVRALVRTALNESRREKKAEGHGVRERASKRSVNK